MSGIPAGFRRIGRRERCPVCEHPEWCLVANDGSNRVLCQRVESGRRWSGAGWLHGSRLRASGPRSIEIEPDPDFAQWVMLTHQYRENLIKQPGLRERLAVELGVTAASLDALDVGWHDDASTWPMRDHFGRAIGIRCRLRYAKRAVRGSRNGLFIPKTEEQRLVLVTEGESDLAAALSLGFFGIGRPGCSGGAPTLCRWLRSRAEREVVIVSDTDMPGIRGANDLAQAITPYAQSVRIIVPPRGAKDLRESLQNGATHSEIMSSIATALPLEAELRRRAP